MFGPFAERRGFVASYVVTYVSSDGEVEIVANPEDDSEVSGLVVTEIVF